MTINPDTRIALVTGGASGIGKAIAEALAEDGLKVVISDLNQEQGQALAEAIDGHFIASDLTRPEACADLVQAINHRYGGVDVLVNNAGIQHVSAIEDFPEEKWDLMMQLMLTTPFLLIKYIWPYIKQKGRGRIGNMGSVHAQIASLNKSAYVSAKHGLLGLTKSAALEGGEHGITANLVCPAYVKTPLVENQIAAQAATLGLSADQVETEVMLKSAAIKRMIQPGEVASLVAYLCSDKASAVTGAAWNIDLGWTAQ